LSETERRNRSIPESIKKIFWDRDGGKCVLCGSKDNLEFDHDIPFSQGGSNNTQNIRVLNRSCNRKKSDNIGLINEYF
jgi:5-methylcytosine-specific restriction endonuclease McrA